MIDLHTHSTVSDGSEAPEEVVELAVKAGLTAVALTDHDRTDGIEAGKARAEGRINLIPGCELSCEHTGTMHVLVYFLEPGGGPLQDELGRLQESRATRNVQMVEALRGAGLPITMAEVEEESGGSGTGRPHIAAVLVSKGAAGSIQEVFDTWLAKGRPGYVSKDKLVPEDALRLARESGALPVLAHPLSLELSATETEATIRDLAELGLAGVEAIYGRYSQDERSALSGVARRSGLAVTGGSDFHGRYKPDLSIGTGRGDLDVPDELLDQLVAMR